MKTKPILFSRLLLGFTVLLPYYSYGQDTVKPAPTEGDILIKEVDTEVSVATGSIFSLDAESLSLTPENSSIPLVFTTTTETPLVDEVEKPVVRDLVRKGIAATVHYTTVGEKLMAAKIIVTRETLAGAGAANPTAAALKRAELTETKVMKNEAARSKALAVEGRGTLMGFEQILTVRVPGETSMTQYTVNNSTLYVDSAGNPVPPHAVRTGISLNVQFVEDAGRKIATKVTVTSMPAWVREEMQSQETGTAGGEQTGTQQERTGTPQGRGQRTTGHTTSGNLTEGFIYQPINSLPVALPPGTKQPQTDQLNPGQPNTTQPNTTQPNTTQPGTTQPGTTQPGTTQPGTTQPGTTQPGTTQPGGNRTAPNQSKPGQPGRKAPQSSASQPSSPASQAK